MLVLNEVVISQVGSEYIAVNERGTLIRLNETGKIILEALIDGDDVDNIVQKMMVNYSVSKEIIILDVITFINNIKKSGFIDSFDDCKYS